MQKNELKKGTKNHTSHFALHTSQKGITLIALIITIIVMLILVGVTINVTLNGGLFTKAQEGAERTKAATEKEMLLNAVYGTIDNSGKINLGEIELPEGFKKISEDTAKVVYEGPSANHYEVEKETGKIEKVAKDDDGESGESIVGLYGNKEYMAIELQEDGKGVFYSDGQQLTTIEYNDNTIMIGEFEDESQREILNYTYEVIRDEETRVVINRCINIEENLLCLTTNESAGFTFNSYDGKHYRSAKSGNFYFRDGVYETSKGSSSFTYYCVYGGYIWEDYPGVYSKTFKINEDGSLIKLDDDSDNTVTYTEVKD